jgi:hypothetical protein
MQVERLTKQGEIPMKDQENDDKHEIVNYTVNAPVLP